MCGIIAYVGYREAYPLLIKGLKRLEYRGYDSAGIAIQSNGLQLRKKKGKVADLEEKINGLELSGNIGIGHTRWATHGIPNDINAHPHLSGNGRFAMIHNGIIENYSSLKKELSEKGHLFLSETDSEVLVHFIEDIQQNENCDLETALRMALQRVVGTYVLVILSTEQPDTLLAARKGSPLVIGIGKGEHFLASDATPIIEYTDQVVYVNDYDIAIVKANELSLKNLENEIQTPYIQKIDLDLAAIEKGGYEHFMLKEIFEQPRTIRDSLRGRIDPENFDIVLGGIREYADQLINARRIIIISCGSSWHAGLVAEYWIEEWCRIPVEVDYSSEFRYRNPIISEHDAILAISQSGETADTYVAIEKLKSMGATIFGICNVVGSSIARISHEGVYTHAGIEIGVASTKTFTAQLSVLALIALKIGMARQTINSSLYRHLVEELNEIPHKVEKILERSEHIESIASSMTGSAGCLFIGRGHQYPIALEGALKLKEISYIHAEGYPAGEMKHGPIALIDDGLPVIAIATRDRYYNKMVSNIQEVRARKGRLIAIVSEGDQNILEMADHIIEVPETHEMLMPIITSAVMQLLAYHVGVLKGCNVDQPRNLAKSVTVE